MVAAGNDQGIVTVFQIPKTPPDSLPESLKPKKNKQVCHNSSLLLLPSSCNSHSIPWIKSCPLFYSACFAKEYFRVRYIAPTK
jgi:hypothetical protein